MITRISPVRSVALVNILLKGPAAMAIERNVSNSYDNMPEFWPIITIVDSRLRNGLEEQFEFNNPAMVQIPRPYFTIIESSMNQSEFAIIKEGDENRIIKAYA